MNQSTNISVSGATGNKPQLIRCYAVSDADVLICHWTRINNIHKKIHAIDGSKNLMRHDDAMCLMPESKSVRVTEISSTVLVTIRASMKRRESLIWGSEWDTYHIWSSVSLLLPNMLPNFIVLRCPANFNWLKWGTTFFGVTLEILKHLKLSLLFRRQLWVCFFLKCDTSIL